MASETETRIRVDHQNEIVIIPASWGEAGSLEIYEKFRGHLTNAMTGIYGHNRAALASAIAPPGSVLLDPDEVAALRRLLDSYAEKVTTVDAPEGAAYGIICAALEGPR